MHVIISRFTASQGTVASVTTDASQVTGLIKGATYAVSNKGTTEIVYLNTDGVTATAAGLPVFGGETKYIVAKNGTINLIGSASVSVNINKVEAVGSV